MKNTPTDHPAASSLPPSDGGGADWALFAAKEVHMMDGHTQVGREILATTAAIIRKHAPTQQPAEQPEAGERAALIHRLQVYGKGICWKPSVTLDEHDQQKLHELLTAAHKALATPRPESPDAQRGELLRDILAVLEERAVGHAIMYSDRLTPFIPRIKAALSALPAKGPGPRSDTERLDWLEVNSKSSHQYCSEWRNGEKLSAHVEIDVRFIAPSPEGIHPGSDHKSTRAAIDAAMDSPPASHSKQREQQ